MRLCEVCGGVMKLSVTLKGKVQTKGAFISKRNIKRYKCTECGLEHSTTLSEEEQLIKAQEDRAKEKQDRKKNKY